MAKKLKKHRTQDGLYTAICYDDTVYTRVYDSVAEATKAGDGPPYSAVLPPDIQVYDQVVSSEADIPPGFCATDQPAAAAPAGAAAPACTATAAPTEGVCHWVNGVIICE